MIKTHKPSGHFWTNASSFQQTKHFRDIRYEELTVPKSQCLAADSDDELSDSERVAKCRRIEKLADDFLNGNPLVVSSARLCPQSLKSIIAWNKKSSDEPKFVFPEVEHSPERGDSQAVWADVEDDAEILERLRNRYRKSKGRRSSSHAGAKVNESAVAEVVEPLQAQAGYQPARRFKRTQVSTGPSEGALKQAAELRARRTQRANSEVPSRLIRSPRLAQERQPAAEPRSDPSHETYNNSDRLKRGDWLLRRQSRLMISEEDPAEVSDDELRLSRIETPSIGLGATRASRTSQAAQNRRSGSHKLVFSAGTSRHIDRADLANVQSIDEVIDVEPVSPRRESLNHNRTSSTIRCGVEPSQRPASYHTAPEQTEGAINLELQPNRSQNEEDNQAGVLQYQGIATASRSSRVSTNENAASSHSYSTPNNASADHESPTHRMKGSRISISDPLHNAGDDQSSKPSRRAKSARQNNTQSSSTTRRTRSSSAREAQSTVDLDHSGASVQFESAKPMYTNAQASQDGSTPFMWRKRNPVSHSDESKQGATTVEHEKEGQHPPVKFPPSDDPEPASKRNTNDHAQPVHHEPPVLDMSFDHDSSFAPNLNMALVDEHLNAVLPAEPGSGRRSSAVKKALRQELRNSGAEMSRCADEPPISSQVEEPHASPEPAESVVADRPAAQSQFWAGTQVLLDQAQRNLLQSPQKQSTHDVSTRQATPKPRDYVSKETPGSNARDPLRPLSQEALPSTQALIGDFQGWSTVKKPRPLYHASHLPTLSAMSKSTWTPINTPNANRLSSSTSDLDALAGEPERRRSSLRFAIPPVESPQGAIDGEESALRHSQSRLSLTEIVTPVPVSRSSGERTPRTPVVTLIHTDGITEGETAGELTSATVQSLSSFQAGQPANEVPQEESNLSELIEDLTTQFLEIEDGVLSPMR